MFNGNKFHFNSSMRFNFPSYTWMFMSNFQCQTFNKKEKRVKEHGNIGEWYQKKKDFFLYVFTIVRVSCVEQLLLIREKNSEYPSQNLSSKKKLDKSDEGENDYKCSVYIKWAKPFFGFRYKKTKKKWTTHLICIPYVKIECGLQTKSVWCSDSGLWIYFCNEMPHSWL